MKTDEQLIGLLQSFAKELGHTPRMIELTAKKGVASSSTYVNRFGSWNKALEIAKLKPNHGGYQPKYTDEQLIGILQSLAKELGHVPRIRELRAEKGAPSAYTYINRFGSWSKALEIAGCDQCTDKQLIEALQIFADKFGHVPRANDMRVNKGMISYRTYVRRFGSWENALRVAKLLKKQSQHKSSE